MVVLDTTLSRMQDLLSEKISVDELEKTLFDMGFELESGAGDKIKIELTHDRPDLIAPQGLARALRYYRKKQRGLPHYKIVDNNAQFIVDASVKKIRPYAVGCIIRNITFTDALIKEIIWVQEKLHATLGRDRKKAAIGIYPLEHIKTPITYQAESPKEIQFVPLGKTREMNASDILRTHETGQKYAHLLNGCKTYPVIRDAKKRVLSMPPIINSNQTGRVTKETNAVFMEVTGTHLPTINSVLTILATMFGEEGATIEIMHTKMQGKTIKTPALEPMRMRVGVENVSETLGVDFTEENIADLLAKMGYETSRFRSGVLEARTLPYRVDVWHEIDIIDDVARAYGFNNVGTELPNVATTGNLLERTRLLDSIRDVMVGLGLSETFTFALSTKQDQYSRMNIKEDVHVSVGKSKAPIDMVRTWLLPELMKNLEQNAHKQYPISLFEASDVVLLDDVSDIKTRNETRLAALLCAGDADFTRIKSVLDAVFRALNIEYSLKESKHASFIKGRVGDVFVGKKKVGVIGEVHPKVITTFGIELPIAAFEIDIESVL